MTKYCIHYPDYPHPISIAISPLYPASTLLFKMFVFPYHHIKKKHSIYIYHNLKAKYIHIYIYIHSIKYLLFEMVVFLYRLYPLYMNVCVYIYECIYIYIKLLNIYINTYPHCISNILSILSIQVAFRPVTFSRSSAGRKPTAGPRSASLAPTLDETWLFKRKHIVLVGGFNHLEKI